MLRPFTQTIIQQMPTGKWPLRNKKFALNFITEYEISNGWETHTNNCTIKFPKNINLYGQDDGNIYGYGTTYNVIQGGSGTTKSQNVDVPNNAPNTYAPLIMKGDIIIINHGYLFRTNDADNQCFTGGSQSLIYQEVPINADLSTSSNLFFGYVASVGSDTPIEIKCEDNFYLLKKTPFPKSVWNQKEATSEGADGTSLYGLMNYMLKLVNAKFNDVNPLYPKLSLLNIPNSITAQFSLGYLEIGSLTCAQVLEKLRQQYHFESTFRGNSNQILQFAFPIYIDSSSEFPEVDANSKNFFCFRDIFNSSGALIASANIFPSHDLEYSNKDDIILSATVQCKVISNLGKSTLLGAQKTKVEKLKVFVFWDIPTNEFKYIDLSTGEDTTKTPALEDGGERHEFWYPVSNANPNPTKEQLFQLGKEQLYRYHYTGFKGCFTTFGFPYVSWNDNVNILDPIYSDRNGQYKVKMVKYKGGMKGLSQEIHLDYKINKAIDITNIISYSLL